VTHSIFMHPWAIHQPALDDLLAQYRAGQSSAIVPVGESALNPNQLAIQNGTAIIPVSGTIVPRGGDFWSKYTACSDLVAAYRNALANDSVQRVAVLFNTPGGSVMGLPEAAAEIHELRGQKPVACFVDGMCASAGYFLASAFGPIYGSSSSIIGSIGSMLMHVSYQGMLDQFGIKATPIHFGKHKVDGNPYVDLNEQSKSTLQEMVDAFGNQFVNAVSLQRGITEKQVMDQYGQGKVFIASEAKSRKMIEGVLGFAKFSSMLAKMQPAAGPENPASIQQFSPAPSIQVESPVVANAVTPVAERDVSSVTGIVKGGRTVKLSPRIKAALYALELTEATDASDEICIAAIKSYCKAMKSDVPESEAEILTLLTVGPKAKAIEIGASEKLQLTGVDFLQVKNDIESAAYLINLGREKPLITAEDVSAAVESAVKGEKTVLQVQQGWKTVVANDPTRQPISVTKTGEDAFAKGVANLLSERVGLTPEGKVPEDMRYMSLIEVGERCAAFSGVRLSGDRREKATQLLSGLPSASGGSWNRPGDFPHLLSGLAGKILDNGMRAAGATYSQWTNRVSDVADFNPKTVIASGMFSNLTQVADGDPSPQLKMSEELKGFVKSDSYRGKVGLTPVMLANDDLDAFMQHLQMLGQAAELTLNGLCVALIASNVTLIDGGQLFNSTAMTSSGGHANLVSSSPGAPSATEAAKIRKLLGKQTALGSSRAIGAYPNVILVPTDHATAAEQTFLSIAELVQMAGGETKVAATDGTINVARGRSRVVVEPGLDSDVNAWYGIDTRFRTIVHVFQAGFGPGGRRSNWFDNDTKTRWYDIDCAFGAAAVGFRGIAKDPGQ